MLNNNLKNLLKIYLDNIPEIFIKRLIINSKKIKLGDLFIALIGYKKDGRDFILEAIENGAIAILAESQGKVEDGYITYIKKIPIIYLANISEKLSEIASYFYNNPANKLRLIAVTGTNGKTTTTQLITQWISLLGERIAVMGTLGCGIYKNLIPTNYTTNNAIKIQEYLYKFVKKKISIIIMEISSHSLIQNRIKGLKFYAAIFINLTHDHLDYHGNMFAYELAKWQLFSSYKINKIIINTDDPVGFKWIKYFTYVTEVSIKNKKLINLNNSWLKVKKIIYENVFTKIYFLSTWGNGIISVSLKGECNVINILLALATLLNMGYSLKSLLMTSNRLTTVIGRMEFFTKNNKSVVVDYAHTPHALKILLKTSRLYCKGKLWCIFGCGGNRDIQKRPIMGLIAEKYSDFFIITNDNPRYENPYKIIKNILQGLSFNNTILIIPNRSQAILYAILKSKLHDLIVIAGKGHENYQLIKNKILKYSDRKIVQNILKNL